MELAHIFAVAALVIGSVTLMGCGGGGGTGDQTFKFVSFSFDSKGSELIVDGKVQTTMAGLRGSPFGDGGETSIQLMFDMDELKFLSSQQTKVGMTEEDNIKSEKTVMIDIKAKQMLFNADINMGALGKTSHLITVPLGDIEPSTFSKCLAAYEVGMEIKDKKVQVFSLTVRGPNPEKAGETLKKEVTVNWQVDEKNVPKELITDFPLPQKVKPEDPEDKTMKLVQATMKVSDKESRRGAPPSEVFQVPAAWGADGKTTLENDNPQIQGLQNVMPDAIWKCAGLPKDHDPMKPQGLLVAQPQTNRAS